MKYVVKAIYDNKQYPEDERWVVEDENGQQYPADEFFYMVDIREFETKEQ